MEPRAVKESASVDDSGVYTFNNTSSKNTSSMSSLSFSSFSMEGSKASSSGCSSLTVSEERARRKTVMKQRVKKCLEELKTLVHASRTPKKKGDTLKTLQHVVMQMKKYKEEAEVAPPQPLATGVDTELVGVSTEGESVCFPLPQTPSFTSNTWFRIVTSDSECTVLDAPSDLLKMLRYPVTYWFDQPLLELVHQRDVVTVSSHLMSAQAEPKVSKDEKHNREKTVNNIFFFRIRHYKSIRQGYCLSRAEKYTAFCGRVSRQKLDLLHRPDVSGEAGAYTVLECSPVNTAYTKAYRPPENNTFVTRHTVHCTYNFVHPSCIALTGYLPQDLIGTSIFDSYHPHDLSILLGCYQQVVSVPGETFRSVPYRMRIKNGQYITVETEWSRFINPWSNKLDFVIGHHNVLEGPQDIDVFNENRRQSVELTPQARSLQKRIRDVLLQMETVKEAGPSVNVLEVPSSTADAPQVVGPVAAAPAVVPFPKPLPPEPTFKDVEEGEKTKDSPTTEEVKTVVAGRDSKAQLLLSEKINIYEQLNYAHNIRRFLLSCARSQYAEGDSSSTKSTLKDENLELFAEKAASNAVNLTLPKPPSFASSTKALVSEREQWEELMPPSPTHEDTTEEVPTVTEDTYQHIPLTEEVIELHNKYQLQSYLSKLSAEKDIFCRQSHLQLHLKRSHSGDGSETKPKMSREADYQDQTGLKNPPNPSNLLFPCSMDEEPDCINPSLHTPPASHHPRPPSHQASTDAINLKPCRPPTAAVGTPPTIEGMRWPCFNLKDGFSYMAVPGSYLPPVEAQPVMNIRRPQATKARPASCRPPGTCHEPSSLNTTSNAKSYGKTSDSSDSLDDYSSSVLYLLDSGSQNNSHSTPSDLEDQNRLSRKYSPWYTDFKWTKDIEMQYTMSISDTKKVLERDQLHLKKLVQPSVVEEQIQDLLEEATPADTFLMDDDCLIQPGLTMSMEEEVGEDNAGKEEEKGNEEARNLEEMKTKSSDMDKLPSHVLCEEKQKNVSDSDSNDGNNSKSSSDLTPSDQRSHDELPSSGKESDNVSSDNQQQAATAQLQPLFADYVMNKLYLPLKVNYQTQQLTSPHWLANAQFNDAVQMQYQTGGGAVQDLLQMDQHQLSQMEQPRAVQEQLGELLADLKEKVSYALTPVTPKDDSPDSHHGSRLASNDASPCQASSSSSSPSSSSSSRTPGEGKDVDMRVPCGLGTPQENEDSLGKPAEEYPFQDTETELGIVGSEGGAVMSSESEKDLGMKSETRETFVSGGGSDRSQECCSIQALFSELEKTGSLGQEGAARASKTSPTLDLMMNLFTGSSDLEESDPQ